MVVCADTVHRHIETWMRKHFDPDARVMIADMTSSYAMLTLQGPKSRALLSQLSPDSFSNEDFPYMSAREIEIDLLEIMLPGSPDPDRIVHGWMI